MQTVCEGLRFVSIISGSSEINAKGVFTDANCLRVKKSMKQWKANHDYKPVRVDGSMIEMWISRKT